MSVNKVMSSRAPVAFELRPACATSSSRECPVNRRDASSYRTRAGHQERSGASPSGLVSEDQSYIPELGREPQLAAVEGLGRALRCVALYAAQTHQAGERFGREPRAGSLGWEAREHVCDLAVAHVHGQRNEHVGRAEPTV